MTIRNNYIGTRMRKLSSAYLFAGVVALAFTCGHALAGDWADKISPDGPAVSVEEGKYLNEDDIPTYNVQEDGTVDWYTYSGYRRYHSECHVCHGPDALGSSFAPSLVDSLKTLSYEKFLDVVTNGRAVHTADRESVMPAFGVNPNVMCYIDDIYVYIKARSDGAIPRDRPPLREDKPEAATEFENACFGR
jgi:methanol metabolism-related c-type cytochrome